MLLFGARQGGQDTSIFVRNAGGGRQFLFYGMSFEASEDLAMVLPLPVPPHTVEDAVRFISLEKCGEFFKAMARGFPEEAVIDRMGHLRPEIERARHLFIRRAPRGLGNAEAHFEAGLERLRTALNADA